MLRRNIGCLCSLLLRSRARPALPARAQDYPSRPIKLLIHTPAGSLVDVLGRMMAQDLGERLGQSIVVDNRTGAATQIAVEQLVRSPPDGYTLMINTSEATMMPFLKKSYRYDPIKDFTPIALVRDVVDGVRRQSEGAGEDAARADRLLQAQPGGVRYGRGGTGGVLHIAVEMLKLKSGGNFVHVPYRGGAQAATDAISGQIEMVSMGLASTRVAGERPVAHPGADRAEPASDAARRADHGGGRPAGRADGHLVRPGRPARHAEGDRRAHQPRARRGR